MSYLFKDQTQISQLLCKIYLLTSNPCLRHLVAITYYCDQTNFTIAVPLRDRQMQTVAEALVYRVIYLFSPPRQIVCDEAM